MDPEETQHLLPDGTTVWVMSTSEAGKSLQSLLQFFRSGQAGPLVFGDAGRPEAAIIPFEIWRAHTEAATDEAPTTPRTHDAHAPRKGSGQPGRAR